MKIYPIVSEKFLPRFLINSAVPQFKEIYTEKYINL